MALQTPPHDEDLEVTLIGPCGSDNGKSLSNQPSNLCIDGSASSVIVSGSTYNWTCDGNYGPRAACSATYTPPPPVVTCGYMKSTTLPGYGNHRIDYSGKCPDGHIGTEMVIGPLPTFEYVQSAWPRRFGYSTLGNGTINGDTNGPYGCPSGYTHKQVESGYDYFLTACVPN